jgi:asparagine synthetase B (glutamine-hydrolysing)
LKDLEEEDAIMPTLAGWLTGEQVPTEIIEQTIRAMESVLELHGGQPARYVQPGVGLVVFADKAYAMQRNDEPPVMDWVPERRTLVYRRPLSGWHPLYYIENWPAEGNLVFASEIKALLALGVPRHLNLAALSALHRYGFIPAPLTAFKEIHVVPAGSILRWQHTKLVVNASTDYHLQEAVDEADEVAVTERVHSLLKYAIEGQLPQHDQLAALTDGGAASMLTTLLSAQTTEARFTIASFSAKKAPKQWKIVELLADVCQRPSLAITGLDHLDFWQAVLAATEAPCADSLPLALHQLLQTVAAETGARVAMSGLGARVILGEERVRNAPPAPLRDEQHVLDGYRSRVNPGKPRELPWTAEAQQRLQDEETWENGHYARRLAHKAWQLTDEWQRDYYLDLHLRLPDLLVGPAQQLATLARIALRSPYLHPDVLNYLTRLPASSAAKGSRSALLLTLVRQLQPELVPVITNSTFSLNLPLQLLLQESGHELLEITLSSEALRKRGLFTAEGVQLLRQQRKISPELLLVFTTQLFCYLYDATL